MKKSGQGSHLDHLWSPWRLDYIIGPKESACVFCKAPARPGQADAGAAADPLVLFQGTFAYVILNLYPYNNGHLMVVPYRHEPSLAGLTREEMDEVGLLIQRAETVLRQAFRLEGINVGVNLGSAAGAGIEEHVHVHLVPRWNGDTNFMTAIGQTRVLPEDLPATARRLRPLFERPWSGPPG